MTDIFISYSRRDKVFTQKLVNALQAANRDVWADWEDIPAASDWDAEIKEGIEKTNSVLFVLSPEWIKSNECRKEMDHAIQHGKRLLPILYLMPDQGQEVPPELAKINWVYMRDTDNFDKAFETLQSAMDTDLDWIKTHTRVQVRAVEWDKKKRDNSFTLRGKDLTDGEQFISSAAGKSPEPTSLQGEFVVASRKDATRRQRITLAGVSIALVVSIALGIVAYFQRQAAVKQAIISRASELSAQAELHITKNFHNSLLLALESFRLLDNEQTRGAVLDTAVANPQLLQFFTGRTSPVWCLAFSPDGKTFASGNQDNTIILWDVSTGKPIGQPFIGHTRSVSSVAFSPDGKTLASGSYDKTIILWDVSTGKPIGQPLTTEPANAVNSIAFSPDGKTLASGSQDNTVILWDVSTGKLMGQPLIGHTSPVSAVAFSPDGKTIVSGSWDTTMILWDVSTSKPMGQPLTGHTDYVYSVAFSPDGKSIASGSEDNTVILWDVSTMLNTSVSTGKPIGQPFIGHTDYVFSVAFSPDGKSIASGSKDNTVILWDVSTMLNTSVSTDKPIGQPLIGHASSVNAVAFSPNGKSLVSGSQDNTIILWDTSMRKPIGQPLTGHVNAVNRAAYSPDGKTLASGSKDNTVILWDVLTRKPIGQPLTGHTSSISSVDFSPDGKTVASGSEDNTIILWDVSTMLNTSVSTGKPIGQPFIGHTSPIWSVAFSSDGQTLASGSEDNTIILWDVSTGKPIGQPLTGHTSSVYTVTFSADGKTLASGSYDTTIILWNASTGKPVGQPLTGHTSSIYSVAFSPDGKTLASGSYDTTIILWDLSTGEPIGEPLIGHTNEVNSVAFSPDGKTLASGSNDTTIILWDLSTREPIGQPLIGHTNFVNSVEFSLDGKTVTSGSEDTTIIFWDVDLQSWIDQSCQRAGRNFTQVEWKRYNFTEPYRKTCEQWPLEP